MMSEILAIKSCLALYFKVSDSFIFIGRTSTLPETQRSKVRFLITNLLLGSFFSNIYILQLIQKPLIVFTNSPIAMFDKVWQFASVV